MIAARDELKRLGLAAAVFAAAATGCGAGPYGHARTYAPLSAEESALAGAVEFDPVMSKTRPDDWQNRKVSIFGVVVKREDRPGNFAHLTLSLRALEPRNLCSSGDDDSCRVTVTSREFERVHAVVKIATPEDAAGRTSLGYHSLVRVIGTLSKEPAADGLPVVKGTYYRHWPRDFYVTTDAADVMRR